MHQPHHRPHLMARHPLVTFLGLVYLIGSAAFVAGYHLDLPPRLTASLAAFFGLAVPALLVTAAVSETAGVRNLVGRSLQWRVGGGWYVLALLGLPIATLLIARVVLGAGPLAAHDALWPGFVTLFLPAVLLPLVLTHLFEEGAWTGFMQDRLQGRYGALRASLLVAPAFAAFHLPIELLENSVAVALSRLVVLVIVALFFRVVVTWLYNRAWRSALIAALFHSAYNTVTGPEETTRFIQGFMSRADALLISLAVVAVAAVVLGLVTRGRLSSNPHDRAMAAASIHG